MEVDDRIRLADAPVPSALPHLSEEESKAKGKAARGNATRESQSVFEPASDRADPISLLEEQATTRFPSSSPSVTGACWSRRSPSSVARHSSWRPTSRRRPVPG